MAVIFLAATVTATGNDPRYNTVELLGLRAWTWVDKGFYRNMGHSQNYGPLLIILIFRGTTNGTLIFGNYPCLPARSKVEGLPFRV